MEDGRGKPTILKEAVFQSLGIQDVTELAEWLFRPSYTNAQLAKMGSFVAKAVEQEDACAIEISQQATHELAILANAVLKKLTIRIHHLLYIAMVVPSNIIHSF